MIRPAGPQAQVAEMREEPTERWPIRQEEREMIEAEQTAPRHRADASLLVELHELRGTVLGTKRGVALPARNRSQTKHLSVPLDRPGKVSDLKSDASKMCGVRQSIADGRYAVLESAHAGVLRRLSASMETSGSTSKPRSVRVRTDNIESVR